MAQFPASTMWTEALVTVHFAESFEVNVMGNEPAVVEAETEKSASPKVLLLTAPNVTVCERRPTVIV